MRVSGKTGRKYCAQPDKLCFKAGSAIALWGHSQYVLQQPAEEKDGDIYISAADMSRLLSGAKELSGERAGVCAAAASLGLKTSRAAGILIVSLTDEEIRVEKNKEKALQWSMSPRGVGELFRAIWLPEAEVVNSYRLYVPSAWKSLKEKKMAVVLHGAGGKEDDPFDRAAGKLSYYAEKYGFLLLAPNSLVVRSNFGGNVPPSGMFREPRFADSQGKPSYYPQAELEENAVAEAGILKIILGVMEEFSVNKESVFIMGNSMGGIGTFHLGAKYPRLFKAMAPAGALPEPSANDWSAYEGRSILFIAGTEDHNSYEKMAEDYEYIKSQGVDIRMVTVGGGVHSTAWTWEIPQIFEFFNANL